MVKKYWMGTISANDDFGDKIEDTFYDAKTLQGPWAIMTPKSFRLKSYGTLGTGFGQKYEKQADGKWLKTEG